MTPYIIFNIPIPYPLFMSLIKEYFELTKQYQREYGEKTIVLMQVGSFLECYGFRDAATNECKGSRIEDLSKLCDLNIANKNVMFVDESSQSVSSSVVMAGFIVPILEKYLKKLQDAGFTVVVYLQDEQCKNTTRSLAGIYSPGTYFAEDSTVLTNHIACLWIHVMEHKLIPPKGKYVYLGLSDVDILTGQATVFQHREMYLNSPTTFDEMERFLSIYKPSEVIVCSNLCLKETDTILQYVNLQTTLVHRVDLSSCEKNHPLSLKARNVEKQVYQKEILDRFFPNGTTYETFGDSYYMENVYACQSFCFLLDFIHQHNPFLVKQINEPVIENQQHRMILANHSLQQLNIVGDKQHQHQIQNKYSSVERMLNQCLTPMGRRQFTYALLNPTTDIQALNEEYAMTDFLLSWNDATRENVQSSLASLKDLSKWNRQLFLKKMPPRCFFSLYQNLQSIQSMFSHGIQSETVWMDYMVKKNPRFAKIHDLCDIWIHQIEHFFHVDVLKEMDNNSNNDINFIQKGVNAELDTKTLLLEQSKDKLESIRLHFNTLLSQYEKKSTKPQEVIKIHETEKHNIDLIATNRRCTILKSLLPKDEKDPGANLALPLCNDPTLTFAFECHQKNIILEAQGGSNQRIQTPMIRQLTQDICRLKSEMSEMMAKTYHAILEQLEAFQEAWRVILDFVTLVDLCLNKRSIAVKYHCCRPWIQENNKEKSSYIVAKTLRHCLIEHIQQNEIYVPNDVELGTPKARGMLLYGTNAVGKTSYIKSIGIALIMAQAGLYVPAASFTYWPYTCLFTRILGNDNLFKGLSTFAVEMSELRTILNQCNATSLVLGDEVCSGTESVSASSIFVAALQKLHARDSSFLFATHMHEIVKYEELQHMDALQIKHMAVLYDREKDVLVYNRKLQEGPGDSMYGLEVCKSLHLPLDFLEQANNLRMKYFPEAQTILSLKTSHFNSQKLVGLCEHCGKHLADEVHHLQHQKHANANGFIEDSGFHKNHAANLISLCEKCHDLFHKTKTQHKKVKTAKGMVITEINT